MHTGEEGVSAGGAALLGVVRHEDAAFVSDAVDVRRFPDHQAAVVDARLHDADVIAHDEQDVWFLVLRLAGSGRAEKRRRGYKQRQAVMGYVSFHILVFMLLFYLWGVER